MSDIFEEKMSENMSLALGMTQLMQVQNYKPSR